MIEYDVSKWGGQGLGWWFMSTIAADSPQDAWERARRLWGSDHFYSVQTAA
jgi:hypothetical protein